MKILGKIILTISLLFLLPAFVFAYQDTSKIGAVVKISVCGDNIVEGQEECESGQGIIYDCKDFGFLTKPIECDASCSYDTLSCIAKKITPVKEEIKEVYELNLPKLMALWDENNNGKLDLKELTNFLLIWVSNWKSFSTTPSGTAEKDTAATSCDLNIDKTCNVTDFSIILYYLSNE